MKYFYKPTVLFVAVFLLCLTFSSVSAEVYIDENNNIISTDTIWTKDDGTYVIYQDILVDSGITLTIEKGTIIKFESNTGMNVLGNLIVNGTDIEKVYFTSLYDDSIGGDTDGNGGLYEPYYSDWGGMYVFDGGEIKLNNSDITYSSYPILFKNGTGVLNNIKISDCLEGISIYGGNISINNSLFENILGDAVYSYSESEINIDNTDFYNIDGDVITANKNVKVNFNNSNISDILGYSFYISYNSSIEINNSVIKNTQEGLSAFANSSITINNSMFDGIYDNSWATIPIFNDSSLTISSSTIKNILTDSVIQAFNGSVINISEVNISDITADDVFVIFGGSEEYATTTFNISNSTLSNGDGNAFQIFTKVKTNISNVKIKDFSGIGIETFSYPEIKVIDSEISGNGIGIASYGSNLEIKNSSILENTTFGIFNIPAEYTPSIKAINNWWGDASGPFNDILNTTGTGNTVSENVDFNPWLLSAPNNKKNPVIIIPGIMASYLNRNDDSKTEIWPDLTSAIMTDDDYLDELIMNEIGKPDTSKPIMLPTDIFRKIKEKDFFDGLIKQLENSGYKEGEDLFVFPYDWRLGINENVSGIYSPALTSLEDKIKQILEKTGSEKIDIIAHSMGGLLAKSYIKNYGNGKVDKFIDIATPHLGSPDAFKVLMYGSDMGIKFSFLGLNADKVKEISQNMLSAYQLLPSRDYFSTSSKDYNYYLDDMDDFDSNGIKGKLSYDQTKEFIKNSGRNSFLLNSSVNIHNDIDNIKLSDYGVKTYNIIGCGVPTVGKIFTLGKKNNKDFEYDIAYISGDKTVPLRSAEYLDSIEKYYITGIDHSTIPSSTSTKELVDSLLSIDTKTFNLDNYKNVSTTSDNCKLPNGTYLSFHSPVDVNIYDENGNHAGIEIGGNLENNISGVGYDIIENNKFVFLPDDKQYEIKLNATDEGSFSSHIKKIQDGEVVETSYFSDLPLSSTSTRAEVKISDTSSDILLDQAGDGFFEKSYTPSSIISGDSLVDRVSPETKIIFISPSSSSSAWLSSDVIISFMATDTDSGILKTEYSLNNIDFIQATSSIKIIKEGENHIYYRSVDKAGNIENTKEYIIKIDRKYPEFVFSVDPKIFELVVAGYDTSSTTLTKKDVLEKKKKDIKTYYKVTDMSGKISNIILNTNRETNYKLNYKINFSDIKSSKDINMTFERNVDKKGKLKSFTQTIHQGRDIIVYRYDVKKSKTLIITRDGREISKKVYNEEKNIEFITNRGLIEIK
jgi:hypothetical protein